MNDDPHPSGDDRYAIYRVGRLHTLGMRYHGRLAETSLDGLGVTLLTLHSEGEFDGYHVGVFDRLTRAWIINPF